MNENDNLDKNENPNNILDENKRENQEKIHKITNEKNNQINFTENQAEIINNPLNELIYGNQCDKDTKKESDIKFQGIINLYLDLNFQNKNEKLSTINVNYMNVSLKEEESPNKDKIIVIPKEVIIKCSQNKTVLNIENEVFDLKRNLKLIKYYHFLVYSFSIDDPITPYFIRLILIFVKINLFFLLNCMLYSDDKIKNRSNYTNIVRI